MNRRGAQLLLEIFQCRADFARQFLFVGMFHAGQSSRTKAGLVDEHRILKDSIFSAGFKKICA